MNIAAFIAAMGIPSAITGFCFWFFERKLSKGARAQEEKDKARKQNEVIIIEGLNAAIALGQATARAVERIPDANCNGDMKAALDYSEKMANKHKGFLIEQGIESLY